MKELKKNICSYIDDNQEMILGIAADIWDNPEPGYREIKTAALVKRTFLEMRLPVEDKIAVTGCRAEIDTGKKGLTIAVLGEMDALSLPGHPNADPESGAAHACGHNYQIASLLGAAAALSKPVIKDRLCGKIVFIAVPAEEVIADDDRKALADAGKIRFAGGKQEMIRLGVFDDIDVAVMVHPGHDYHCPSSFNGFIMKKITFTGRAAHAGLSPESGVNALAAANLALSAIDSQRDTFRDEDTVRVHGIITNGGSAVNIVPDVVEMEIQVRAKTISAIRKASFQVERAVRAGALALGAKVSIETLPGYMPLRSNPVLRNIYRQNLQLLHPEAVLRDSGHRPSSTDMGDLSCLIPILHPYSNGIEGKHHSREFRAADKVKAAVEPAKILAMTVVDLMSMDNIESDYDFMSKNEYVDNIESFADIKTFNYMDVK